MIPRRQFFGVAAGGGVAAPAIATTAASTALTGFPPLPPSYPPKYVGEAAAVPRGDWLRNQIENIKREKENLERAQPPDNINNHVGVDALKSVSAVHRQAMVQRLDFEHYRRQKLAGLERRLVDLSKELMGL